MSPEYRKYVKILDHIATVQWIYPYLIFYQITFYYTFKNKMNQNLKKLNHQIYFLLVQVLSEQLFPQIK